MKRKGLALILVVGVLAVLAVLGSVFAVLSRMERKAATQRVLSTTAALLARSGIEDALARLGAGQDPSAPESAYAGESWDATSDLSSYEASQEVYQRTGAGTPANLQDCPVRFAMRPSFFARGAGGNPKTLPVDGRERGYSGALHGGTYALRLSSGFHVNGGDPAAAPADGYNAVLKRVLGVLAEAVGRETGAGVSQADGENLVVLRPPSGWTSFEAIRDTALGGSQAKLDALRPYLLLQAWVDLKVIAPNAPPTLTDTPYASWSDMLLAHTPTSVSSVAPDFERIGGRIVGRAPVDLAWARRSRPALIALLADLRGYYLDEVESQEAGSSWMGHVRTAELRLDWSRPTDDCRSVADQILASTSELDTWERWNAFCDSLQIGDDAYYMWSVWPDLEPLQREGMKQAQRDLLKAAFNPNSDLNKFNPNPCLWRSVDKQDVVVHSTELSLFPVQGFQAECVGRAGGASRALRAVLPGPRLLRLTTQKELVCEELGRPEVAGDEGDPRLPGRTPYVSLSRDPQARTWGHALAGLGGQGISLQSYPEPCTNPGTGLRISPADCDGSLQLATIETPDNGLYMVSAPPNDMKLLARFTAGLDLDVADSGNRLNQTDLRQASTAEMGNSAFAWSGSAALSRPNTLRPDGSYSEVYRAPAYLDRGNADGFHGVLSFWLKRNYRLYLATSHGDGQGRALVNWSNLLPGGGGDFTNQMRQFWVLCDGNPSLQQWKRALCCCFEVTHTISGLEELLFHTAVQPVPEQPRGWHLVTMYWDLRSVIDNDCGELVLDDGLPADELGDRNFYGSNDPSAASDLTMDDMYGTHVIGLGERGKRPNRPTASSGPDATLDEFAIYDFGGAGPDGVPAATSATLGSPQVLALNRYREGRYYKGSAYRPATTPGWIPDEAPSWVSGPIRLPPGSRIRGTTWTWIRPSSLPDDYPQIERVNLSGDAYVWEASAFRARVVFRRPVPLGLNTPILESPVLDDLGFLYDPPGGTRVLAWEP